MRTMLLKTHPRRLSYVARHGRIAGMVTALFLPLLAFTTSALNAATTYHVSDALGNDANDGLTEITAVKTVAAALAKAVADDTVLVYDGTYLLTSELLLDKAVTLRSVNGRDAVALKQTVNNNRVASITAAGAVLSGFRITPAKSTSSAINGLGLNVTAAAMVTNCVIAGATGGGQNRSVTGGGIYMSAAGLIVDCIISNNVMDGAWGSGVAISAGTLDRCLVVGNKGGSQYSGGAGCGVWLSGSATVQNCLVVSNTSIHYGGAGVWMTGGTLQNCTIANNVGPANGAGLYQSAGAARNLVVFGNQPNEVHSEAGTLTHSCAPGLVTGTGNLSANPRFANAAGGEYRLSAGSPCVDAGTNATGVVSDFARAARPADGDDDSVARMDMGCHEFQIPAAGLWCGFNASATVGLNTLDTTFTAAARRDGGAVVGASYDWDFGDSGTGSGQSAPHTYAQPGDYTVTLTVTDAFGSAVLARTGMVRVVAPVAYVSTNGAHVFPYAMWENAATNVQEGRVAATLAAQSGAAPATLRITNGLYNLNGELLIEAGIVVEGAGPNATLLRQNAGIARCVRMLHADAVLSGLTVTNGNYNVTAFFGGHSGMGIYMTNGLVTNCVATGSRGGGQNWVINGGGIYVKGGGRVVDCTLRGNSGGMTGGGAFMDGGLLDRCVITQNSAVGQYSSSGGGGVNINNAATVQNCLIVTNTTTYKEGGGVRMTSSGGIVQNCTIAGNLSGSDVGGGVLMTAGILRNAILYGNKTAAAVSDLQKTGGAVTYCCIPDPVSGLGNITTPPAFVDYANGDHHLTASSPCVDTGTNVTTLVSDLDGGTRLADGTGDGTAIMDMGCYEFALPSEGLTCSFDVDDPSSGIGSAVVTFTTLVRSGGVTIDSNEVTYTWTFGDGAVDAGQSLSRPTHTYSQTGTYSVQLDVSYGGTNASFSRPDCVAVYRDTIYVAVPGAGTHAFPYDTPTKAATNMGAARLAAVGAANSGAGRVTIVVGDGTHTLDSELVLDRPFTVQSVNGPGVTTLRPAAVSRIINISHSNVVVSGFTITNGQLSAGGNNGAGILMTGGLVTNCVLTDNRAGTHGNPCYGGGVAMSGGLVVDCVIRNSRGFGNDFQMGSAVYMTGGMMDRCIISNNWGGHLNFGGFGGAGVCLYNAQAILRNCLIVSNRTEYKKGGGVYLAAGTIENCTIADNVSGVEAGGGLYLEGAGSVGRNLIVYGNRTNATPNDVYVGAGGTVTYSCAPELTGGAGNVITVPLFKNLGVGNYRILGGATVDAGTNLSWVSSFAIDLDRRRRLFGQRVDMGCYEFAPDGSSFAIR
jgi:serine protease